MLTAGQAALKGNPSAKEKYMPTLNRNILVSGASVAGPVLAYWLARYGFRPVVVERAPEPRGGGYPIDVRGPAVTIADRMGIAGRLNQARVDTAAVTFVDAVGRRRSSIDSASMRAMRPSRDVELPRGDLVRILYEVTKDHVEYVFDDSIRTMDEDGEGVTVHFDRGAPRRFDLVVGADGLHSIVRRLAFGEERRFTYPLGYCVAAADVDATLGLRDQYVQYNAPGRMAGIYRYLDRATAIFVFAHRDRGPLPFSHGDTAAQKRMVTRAFPETTWDIPRLLAQATAAPDFYFDAVSQIRMPSWSRGRAALVGDAAHAPALLTGQGTTLAMMGAYALAGELHAAGGDRVSAFARYEAVHRRPAARGQRMAWAGAAVLVPGSSWGIRVRDQVTRAMLPLAKAGRLLRRTHPITGR
jgi:2-polyprenyl-6-methoxyphenol hydroxylase-like FAD-dependent oxidoreductase